MHGNIDDIDNILIAPYRLMANALALRTRCLHQLDFGKPISIGLANTLRFAFGSMSLDCLSSETKAISTTGNLPTVGIFAVDIDTVSGLYKIF